MVNAATEFKKSGFSEEDSAQLAQVAAMYQNVADEAVSTGESANFIISQMKAFGLEAQDATHIIDALNAVSNSQAVSSADLANNIGKASSAMALGNNTYEQALAMMAAITEINRSGAKSARALVSVQSRLTQVLDGQSSTGAALIGIYDELGVELFDMDGQLRPTFEIFKDLAEIWPTLSTNQKDYIALTQAGANQTQNFVALMNNFQTALDSEQTALNSTNSALDENARYMESLEAKTTALKNTFQDLANNVVDSELVGSLLTLANDALEVLNTKVGTTVTQWGLLTGVLTGGIVIFGDIGVKLISSLKAIAAFKGALGAGAGAASAFVSAALPIAGILAAVVVGGTLFTKWLKDTNPSLEEATSQLESVNTQLQTNSERLAEINSLEWNELTPEILAEKDALEKENEELRAQIELLEERKKKSATIQARTGGTVSSGYVAAYNGQEYVAASGTYQELVQILGEQIPGAAGKTKEELESLGIVFNETGGEIYKNAEGYNDYLIESMNNYIAQLNATHELNNEQVLDFNNLRIAIEERVIALKALQDEGEELTEQEEELIAVFGQLNNAYSKATSWTEQYGNAVEITEAQANNLKTKFPELTSLIKQNGEAYYFLASSAAQAVDDIRNSNGQLYASDKERVLNTLKLLQAEVDARREVYLSMRKSTGIWSEESQKAKGEFINTLLAKNKLQQLIDSTETLGWIESSNVSTVSGDDSKSKKTKSATDKSLEEFKTLQGQIKHQLEMGEITETEYYNKLEQLVKEYKEKAIAHMKEYGLTVDKINENMYSYEEDIYKKRLELQKSDMETAVSYLLKKIDDEISALEDAKDAINKKYDDEIQKIQDTNDKLEQQIEYEEKLNQLAQAKQQQVYVFKGGQFQYMQDVDEIASAQAELDAYERERVMQVEIDSLEAKRDAEIAAIDEQIEYWNRYKEEWTGVVAQYTEEQNRLIAEQQLGIDFEKANWEKRLENAQDFANRYNSIMSSINPIGSSSISSSSSSKRSSSSGKKYYFDYSKSSTGGWTEAELKASTVEGYAGGTLSSSGGLSLVGESGPELRVLNSGDGVLPADITRNLWDWGKFNPKSMMSTMSQVFNIDNLTLPNAHDAAGLITGLKQMAYQRAYKRA